ncbi:MAG: HAMP domain-containing histidine kinase [Spirochaetaceae bacterium]|nr:HAMP domain-containing histidine kinase [Spirochaetaceae bacterium]
MTTIFFRILKSFILIILLTVLLSTAIEFFSTKKELPQLLTEVRTKNIAHYLGASYTREGGWENLSDEIMWLEQENINKSTIPSMRIIVRDSDGKTLYNSFTQLSISSDSPLIEGRSIPILNLRTGKTAGTITAYIDKNYLEVETVDYLISLLIPRLLQGVITIFIAFIAAFLLSRRITKPITALTKAAEVISLKENTPILPIESKDELGRMSESFNRMVRSLEHQQKLRKRLIGDVSHEILTPLNLIRLEARGLLDEITTPSQGAPKIIEEVDQMKNLIQDLDWLAETDSGEYHLKKEMVSLSPLIQKEVESWYLKGEAEDKEIILMDLPSGLPLINIDPLRFSQALGNLIENAIKYSYPKSSIRINCYMEESSAVISVQDQSTGIASKDKANLFERFYQADTSRTSNNSGRGLGLAIVQQIMELHNGKVWFTSKQNEGSTFFISLPLKS